MLVSSNHDAPFSPRGERGEKEREASPVVFYHGKKSRFFLIGHQTKDNINLYPESYLNGSVTSGTGAIFC